MRPKVQDELASIFLKRFNIAVRSWETDLIATQSLDSVKIVDLVLELESRFGVSLPFEELEIEDFRTIRKIADKILASA